MDREGFRNRLKQYKQAREENPGLKYWEWKNVPKYDEGTDGVRDNTYVAPIEKEQVFIPATGATKFLQEYKKRTPRGGNLEIVSPEFDLFTGIRIAATLPTKAEKLGRILDNTDFITDDKISVAVQPSNGSLSKQNVAQIRDIVLSKTAVTTDNIVVIEVK